MGERKCDKENENMKSFVSSPVTDGNILTLVGYGAQAPPHFPGRKQMHMLSWDESTQSL